MVATHVIRNTYAETACLLASCVLWCTLGGFVDFISDDESFLIGRGILVEGFLAQK